MTSPDMPPATASRQHPVIVLVRPQLGENIGKAARAMLNFGFEELRLVNPRDGWPNPDAGPAASGADHVLAQAKLYHSTAEALADCQHVWATTVRKRGVSKPVYTPEAACKAIIGQSGRHAFLFGPERSGLDGEDVNLAQAIVTARINPEFGSLNLAQAVLLMSYEYSRHVEHLEQPTLDEGAEPPAPMAELEGLVGQMFALLDERGYFFPPDRTPATQRTLRNLLTKPGWTSSEIRNLRGILKYLTRDDQNGNQG